MSEQNEHPPSETEQKIIEGAIRTFLRFGAKKTTMSDIADAAGVSRQTVYDAFGNKDEVIRASIRSITDKNLAELRLKTDADANLSKRLDIYFEDNVIKNFEMMQISDDPQDLVTGHNDAGKAEIANSRRKHEQLLIEWLTPHDAALADTGHTVASLAHFIVVVTMAFKYEASDRSDLDELLRSLKTMIMSSAQKSLRRSAVNQSR